MQSRLAGYGLFIALVGVGALACSDDDGSSGGGGGVKTVCGITCGGTASCLTSTGPEEGTVRAEGSACVITGSEGTATLKCDNTASFTSPEGDGDGTWSGSGTSVTFTDPGGATWSCTISPPASSGTGGGAGSGGGGSSDACEDCAQASCGAQYAGCTSAEGQCGQLVLCMSNCADTDEQCMSACVEQYPQGGDDLAALVDCMDSNCGSVCGG